MINSDRLKTPKTTYKYPQRSLLINRMEKIILKEKKQQLEFIWDVIFLLDSLILLLQVAEKTIVIFRKVLLKLSLFNSFLIVS